MNKGLTTEYFKKKYQMECTTSILRSSHKSLRSIKMRFKKMWQSHTRFCEVQYKRTEQSLKISTFKVASTVTITDIKPIKKIALNSLTGRLRSIDLEISITRYRVPVVRCSKLLFVHNSCITLR
ncbi:hypothetical protein BpHYR1_002994 [Brachionus plicatilis]|uniref:Uncharacterized protein n=1 Tax=Brachionus plicatilis TaxID=10195 RepID=A0A3M7RFT7_BRAPC|nr:hypothetical protein BpHYR1_002994 [Brachionus plicatilis]